jgi:hypothetical protein
MYTKYNQSNNVHIKIFSAGFMTLMVMFILSSVSSSSNIIRDWLWVSWGIVIAFQNLESEIDNG